MRIAQLILHYSRDDLTRQALSSFPDAMVVDNGSPVPFPNAAIRFSENLGFTRGFNAAVSAVFEEYDVFLLLNNDIVAAADVVPFLAKMLEQTPSLGIVSPYCNSPHDHMGRKSEASVRAVPFVEFVAVAIRRDVFCTIGMFDERFSLGWGVDYDFCWRARNAGFMVGVCDEIGVHHLEHQTIDSTYGRDPYFQKASREMHDGLTEKYGPSWFQRLTEMPT